MLKKILLATLIAMIVSSIITISAFAASYYISEYSGEFTSLNLTSLNPCSAGWTCRDSNAKRNTLSSSGGAWGIWWSTQAGATAKRMDWYTFIPNDGTYNTWGAVQYWINNEYNYPSEAYYTTVNQTNWKGQGVYLGFLDRGDYRSHMQMENYCLYGFTCDTSFYVLWDRAQFNY